MMPFGRLATCSGLTSGTTRGTSGSMRNAPELSTTTAPRAAATGPQRADTSSGTSNMATSTPSKTSADSACTSVCLPRTLSRRPAERGEATSRISPQTSSLVDSRSSITVPTAPVAPTTASVGRPVTGAPAGSPGRWPRPRPGASPARPAVDDGLYLTGIQVEGAVRGGHRRVHLVLVHHDRDPDFRGGDHLDVHAGLGERAEERGRHPRVRPHAGPYQGHLADPVVVEQRFEPGVQLDRAQRGQRGLAVVAGQGERDVGEPGGCGREVLHDHVDVDAGRRDCPEDLRRLPDHVRHAQDGDLRLAPVVCDAGYDRLLHSWPFHLTRLIADPGPRPVAERGPGMNRDGVPPGVLHAAQLQ